MSNKTDFLAIAIASAVNGQFMAVQNLSLALSLVSSDKAKEVIKDFKEKTVNLGLSQGYANDLSSLASFVDNLKLISFKEIKSEKTTLSLLSVRLGEKGVINLASLKGFKAFNTNNLKTSVQDAYKFDNCSEILAIAGDGLIVELSAFNKLSQGYNACKAIALKVSDFVKACTLEKSQLVEDTDTVADADTVADTVADTDFAVVRASILASLTTSELLDVIATHDNDSLNAILKGVQAMIKARNKKAA